MMNTSFSKCLAGCALLLSTFSVGSAEPTLDAVRAIASPEKRTEVIFLYEEKNFEFKETRYGGNGLTSLNPRAHLGETDFPAFGDLMVSQAGATLGAAGLKVIHAGYAPEGRLQDYQKELPDLLGEKYQHSLIVVVTPFSADTLGGNGKASVNVRLMVVVRRGNSDQVLWEGMVNTATLVGRGPRAFFLTEQRYDQAYAVSVLNLLAQAWRKSGIF